MLRATSRVDMNRKEKDNEQNKRDNEAKGEKIENTDTHRQAGGQAGRQPETVLEWISVAREQGRGGKGREREVGLDDIMCCYSPAEAWQEDF